MKEAAVRFIIFGTTALLAGLIVVAFIRGITHDRHARICNAKHAYNIWGYGPFSCIQRLENGLQP